jgi:gamma-glutamyl phosphate reductase
MSENTNIDAPEHIAQTAKAAFEVAQLQPSSERERALLAIADALEAAKADVLAANAIDLEVRRPPLFAHHPA